MANIIINDNVCWICNETGKKMTVHHGLPQHLKPVQNVLIPVCKPCHDKINAADVSGMYSYAYKLLKHAKDLNIGARNIIKVMDEIKENGK